MVVVGQSEGWGAQGLVWCFGSVLLSCGVSCVCWFRVCLSLSSLVFIFIVIVIVISLFASHLTPYHFNRCSFLCIRNVWTLISFTTSSRSLLPSVTRLVVSSSRWVVGRFGVVYCLFTVRP
jgi:hypothetical protein